MSASRYALRSAGRAQDVARARAFRENERHPNPPALPVLAAMAAALVRGRAYRPPLKRTVTDARAAA